jgi:hypothetical protein
MPVWGEAVWGMLILEGGGRSSRAILWSLSASVWGEWSCDMVDSGIEVSAVMVMFALRRVGDYRMRRR